MTLLWGLRDWSHILTHITYSAVQILVQVLTVYLKCNFAICSSAAAGVEGHSFIQYSDDRSKASSKTMPSHSAIQSLLLQMRISSPVLKVIQ